MNLTHCLLFYYLCSLTITVESSSSVKDTNNKMRAMCSCQYSEVSSMIHIYAHVYMYTYGTEIDQILKCSRGSNQVINDQVCLSNIQPRSRFRMF